MDDFFVVHSSDNDPDELQRLLAERIAQQQIREFRRVILTCFAAVMAIAWLLSWPLHLLPHTVLWSLLATAAFVIGLYFSPTASRSQPRYAADASARSTTNSGSS
jgi:Flp pilus assembly protein TadB